MNRVAASILLAGMCACKKHEDAATVKAETTATPATTDSTVVAAIAPSESASAVASASPSASAASSADARRRAALEAAKEYGMIGLLNSGAGGDPNAPTAAWGRDSLGDAGNVWGDKVGDAFGAGGLGLQGTGTGSGGGGQGEGIGLGNIGTIGHGAGTGTGQGFGSGSGRLGGSHSTHTPRIRQGQVTVNGRLPPEVINRIARQNFGRFRLCYENGLRSDPKLSGTVATKFVIDGQGAVSSATRDAATTMSDAGVVSCVTRGFSSLSFPKPEAGVVVVTYPLVFEPGDP